MQKIVCVFLPKRVGRPLKHTGAFAAKGEDWQNYSEYLHV